MGFLSTLSWSTLKKHPPLIPLVFFGGVGLVGSILYTARVLIKSPDISWNKTNNPEPWNEYSNKAYRLYHNDKKVAEVVTSHPKY